MSKSVTIPSSSFPNWECVINGVKYSYPAGTTQTVPDEVADIIENSAELDPKEKPEEGTAGQVWTKTEDGAEWKDIPSTPSPTPASKTKVYCALSGGTPYKDVAMQTAMTFDEFADAVTNGCEIHITEGGSDYTFAEPVLWINNSSMITVYFVSLDNNTPAIKMIYKLKM